MWGILKNVEYYIADILSLHVSRRSLKYRSSFRVRVYLHAYTRKKSAVRFIVAT